MVYASTFNQIHSFSNYLSNCLFSFRHRKFNDIEHKKRCRKSRIHTQGQHSQCGRAVVFDTQLPFAFEKNIPVFSWAFPKVLAHVVWAGLTAPPWVRSGHATEAQPLRELPWFTDGYVSLVRPMEVSPKFLLELSEDAKWWKSQPGASGNYYCHPLEKACLRMKPMWRKSELRDRKQLILENIFWALQSSHDCALKLINSFRLGWFLLRFCS